MKKYTWMVDIDDYAPLIGEETLERILHKSHRLRGLRVLHLILLAVDGLRGIQRQAVGIVIGVAAGQAGFEAVVAHIAAQIDVGQQPGTALHRLFLAGLAGGAGGGVLRIVGLRVAQNIGQVRCVGSGCQRQRQCDEKRLELHGESSP